MQYIEEPKVMTSDEFIEYVRKLAEFGKVTQATASIHSGYSVVYEGTPRPADTSMADAFREVMPRFISALSKRNGLQSV